jgi:hypothetical protein
LSIRLEREPRLNIKKQNPQKKFTPVFDPFFVYLINNYSQDEPPKPSLLTYLSTNITVLALVD